MSRFINKIRNASKVKDNEFNFQIPSTHNTFIYLINGEIKIGNQNHDKVKDSTLIVLEKGEKLKVSSIINSKFLSKYIKLTIHQNQSLTI